MRPEYSDYKRMGPFAASRLEEVAEYRLLSRDKALKEVSGGHFGFGKSGSGKGTAMDSKGNKVLVCDNGTGVSFILIRLV